MRRNCQGTYHCDTFWGAAGEGVHLIHHIHWLAPRAACPCGVSARQHPTAREAPEPLLVEPDVFHAPTVEDAVDHQGQPFNVRLPTRPVAAVEDDRSSIVLRQLPFDLPHQLLSLLLVRLARLPT